MSTYRPSSIKRDRRTKAEMEELRDAIERTLRASHPMTLRQCYYRLVTQGAIDKTEAEYRTVGRLLVEMRLARRVPFRWLTDATRWVRRPTTYSSLADALQETLLCYRRSVWADQRVYCEVWCEKTALAGVLYPITEEFDVPLYIGVGYPSLTYRHACAEALEAQGKPCHIYYLGDFDPTGVDISRKLEADLRMLAPNTEIHFERIAVTREQIVDLGLPTRPTKRTDSRAKRFRGRSVELDAIEPETLRALVREKIEQHINQRVLCALLRTEELERETLRQVIGEYAS